MYNTIQMELKCPGWAGQWFQGHMTRFHPLFAKPVAQANHTYTDRICISVYPYVAKAEAADFQFIVTTEVYDKWMDDFVDGVDAGWRAVLDDPDLHLEANGQTVSIAINSKIVGWIDREGKLTKYKKPVR